MSAAARYIFWKSGSSKTSSGRSVPAAISSIANPPRTAQFSRRASLNSSRVRTVPLSRSTDSSATAAMYVVLWCTSRRRTRGDARLCIRS